MPITSGQALALGNLARPDTTKVFSQAAMRKQQLDLADKAAEAKRKEEENKLRKELEGLIGHGKGGFDPLFQERANKIMSQGFADQMKYAQNMDRVGINSRKAKMDAELADLLEENKRFRGTLDEMEKNGLTNKEITKILNMRGTDAVDYYKKIATERPEVQSFINLDDPKEGKFTANYINNIGLNEELQKAAKMLEETATPVYDKGKPVYQQIGHTKLYRTAANPQARQQVAMSLASTKDGVDNVKLLHPKEYKQAFEALSVEAQNKGLQVDPLQIQQAAAAQVLDNQLAKMSVYNIKESDWKPTKDTNINLGGGYVTPNKWGLFPSNTAHKVFDEKTIRQNEEQLAALNAQRKRVNPNATELTYEQAYPNKEAQKDYDEVVFENQDVSENKTFKYPNGQGGLIDVTPISVRRKKGTNDWVLVGKEAKQVGGKTTYKDIELPYNSAVRQKTDAILGTNTSDYLNNTFGVNKTKSTPQTKAVPLTKIKSLIGKKGYEGYTEKELVDYYKSQGYTIN